MRKGQERRGRSSVHSEKGVGIDCGGNKKPVAFWVGVMRVNFFVLYSALHVREKEGQEH